MSEAKPTLVWVQIQHKSDGKREVGIVHFDFIFDLLIIFTKAGW